MLTKLVHLMMILVLCSIFSGPIQDEECERIAIKLGRMENKLAECTTKLKGTYCIHVCFPACLISFRNLSKLLPLHNGTNMHAESLFQFHNVNLSNL